MQKFILLAILAFFSINYSAAQSLWLQTGFSSTSARYEHMQRNELDHEKFNPGFQTGLVSEFPLSRIFFIQPGIILQTKGYFQRESFPEDHGFYENGFNFWYLDIPVLLSTKIPVHNVNLFIGSRPYAGIGLSGTNSYSRDLGDEYPTFAGKDKFK